MSVSTFLAPTSTTVTLIGCCHCKANKFTVTLPELKSVLRCNCSICSINGGFWLFPRPEELKWERTGVLTRYQWGGRRFVYEFCSVCGNHIRTTKESGAVGLNVGSSGPSATKRSEADDRHQVRMLQDVNLWELEFNPDHDGASDGPPYQPPVFQGPSFQGLELGDDRVYHGSCHCGAVTLEMKTKPLAECMVNECNCSSCWRAARIHCYPNAQDVHLGGAETLTRYELNPGFGAYFCKVCGSHMLVGSDAPVQGTNGEELVESEQTLGHSIDIGAVNVRCLHGVDLKEINVNKYGGRENPPVFTVD